MSGGKYVDSEVRLGGCAPGRGAQGVLLLLSPTLNILTALLAPALSRRWSTPLALALLRNGLGRGGEEEAGMFHVSLLGRGPSEPSGLGRGKRGSSGS